MTSIEVGVRTHEPVNAVDDRFEAAAFDGKIVFEAPRHPDSAHFLEEENSEASRLHDCHLYRPKPYQQQGLALLQEGLR